MVHKFPKEFFFKLTHQVARIATRFLKSAHLNIENIVGFAKKVAHKTILVISHGNLALANAGSGIFAKIIEIELKHLVKKAKEGKLVGWNSVADFKRAIKEQFFLFLTPLFGGEITVGTASFSFKEGKGSRDEMVIQGNPGRLSQDTVTAVTYINEHIVNKLYTELSKEVVVTGDNKSTPKKSVEEQSEAILHLLLRNSKKGETAQSSGAWLRELKKTKGIGSWVSGAKGDWIAVKRGESVETKYGQLDVLEDGLQLSRGDGSIFVVRF